ASSNPGDIILDPFLGSGTTSVVAKKLGRNYIGIEENPQYCVWAEKRLEMADTDKSIQGYTDGVFWDRNTLTEQNAIKARRKHHILRKEKQIDLLKETLIKVTQE
ncbi:MAG TPA: site-specific DNA-methyltransferase, partial [Fervidobacterium sp.]|nr:site-specific DNA-methyltransferase [Fervidobacterium sp.]